MDEPRENSETIAELPEAKVKRSLSNLPVVWIVPMLAAIVAGYLVYERVREFGPKITIAFKDAEGIKEKETPIKYHGVPVGEVTAVELGRDLRYALVTARLHRSALSIARQGSIFWIVRPEVGIGNIAGLATVITGPYIEVLPGSGETKAQFVGLDNPPVTPEQKGLRIVLVSSRLESLKPKSPIYYRGVQVGSVEDSRLSRDATHVDVHIFIEEKYAKLVRRGSVFWNVSGVNASLGLFHGLEINVESLRSLVAGGIAFATPDSSTAPPAKNGSIFLLFDKPQKEWLEWAPKIPISSEK